MTAMRCSLATLLAFSILMGCGEKKATAANPSEGSTKSSAGGDVALATGVIDAGTTHPLDASTNPGVPGSNGNTPGYSLRFYGHGTGFIDRVIFDIRDKPINLSGDFTLEFWLRPATGNQSSTCYEGEDAWINGNVIVDRDVYGTDAPDFGVSLFGGKISFGVRTASDANAICSGRTLDESWHHVAVTRLATGQGTLRIYLDGQLSREANGPTGNLAYATTSTQLYPNNTNPYLVIGAEKHDVGPSYPSFSGWFDELRISNNIRYASAFASPAESFSVDSNTIALYHFDEGSGNVISDSAGTNHGERRFGGSEPAGPEWTQAEAFVH